MRLQTVIAMATFAACGMPAFAHHSFSAVFDSHKPVRLVGTLTKIEWENPHVHFYVDVRSSDGQIYNWTCESGAPAALKGWKGGGVKVGDQLVVDGYLAKDGSRFMDAQRVTLPDGRKLVGDPAQVPGAGAAGAGGSTPDPQ